VEAALQALRYDEIDKPGLARLLRDIEGLSDASIKDLGGKIEAAAADGRRREDRQRALRQLAEDHPRQRAGRAARQALHL
jgi:hypothetical protein